MVLPARGVGLEATWRQWLGTGSTSLHAPQQGLSPARWLLSGSPALLPAPRTPFHSGRGEGSCLNIVSTPLKCYQVNELQTQTLFFFVPQDYWQLPGLLAGSCHAAGTSPHRKNWEGALGAPKHLHAGQLGVLRFQGTGLTWRTGTRGCPGTGCSWGWGDPQHPKMLPRAADGASGPAHIPPWSPQSFRDHQHDGRCLASSIPAWLPVQPSASLGLYWEH